MISKKGLIRLCSLVLMVMLIGMFSGCTIRPCGNFSFSGSEYDTTTVNGIDAAVTFNFDPSECGSACSCGLIPYVQIVRTWSFDSAQPLYPSTEKQERATSGGWYIDRVAGRKWGYYGRNDDGSFAYYLTPGSDALPAVLMDAPRRPESSPWLNIWWQAVSVPACIDDTSGCSNQMAGYYFWSWLVDDTGGVAGIFDANAWKRLDDVVDDAVDKWDIQAAGLGKHAFPDFGRLTE